MKLTRFFGLDPEFVEHCRGATNEGERRLMFAVLEDAIRCFQGSTVETRLKRYAIDEAEQWIMDDSTGVFSFRAVCDELGIDPDFLRAGLKMWRAFGGHLASSKSFGEEVRTARRLGNRTMGLAAGRDPQSRSLS